MEAPVLSLTAAAWALLVLDPGGSLAGSCCKPSSLAEGLSEPSVRMLMLHNPPASLALGWLLMLVAMMGPLIMEPIRHVLDRSFANRRRRAVSLFVFGYAGVWMAAGALVLPIGLIAHLFYPTSFAPAIAGGALAFVWQSSPAKQVCLNRGHGHPALAAFGAAADYDAIRFGLSHGFWCVGSCWALMLLPELMPTGHVASMAGVTLLLLAERLGRPSPPRWRLWSIGSATRFALVRARMLNHNVR